MGLACRQRRGRAVVYSVVGLLCWQAHRMVRGTSAHSMLIEAVLSWALSLWVCTVRVYGGGGV